LNKLPLGEQPGEERGFVHEFAHRNLGGLWYTGGPSNYRSCRSIAEKKKKKNTKN